MSGRRKAPIRSAAPKAPGKAPARRAYKPQAYKKVVPQTSYYQYYKTPTSFKKSYPKAAEMSGSMMPDSIGATMGGYLGHGIQGVVKALTGFGDYKVRGNSLMGGNPPIIRNSRNNGIIVRHREYLADVFAATPFTVATYPINPGLIGTFPWLQQQADSYEQYKFRGLVFEFKTMSSDAVLSTSASSALGTVIMSTQYNVLDESFVDKRTMENYEYANSTKPSCSIYHPVECKMSQTTVSELYVRKGVVTTGDLRLYDLGNFSVAVQGMQNAAPNQVIGELWCTYEIEFFKPKLLIGGGALLTDHWAVTTGAPNAITSTLPFGIVDNTLSLRAGSNLGTTIQVAAVPPYNGNTIIFPRYVVDGLYLINYTISGASPVIGTVNYNATGNGINVDILSTKVKIFIGNTTSFTLAPTAGSTGAQVTLIQLVRITQDQPGVAPGFQLVFTAGALPTTGAFAVLDVVVTQVASQLT